MQRLRIKFTRGMEIKFISHLDMMRMWERAMRRAGVPIAYSQGFSPHPQMSIAAPLSVGMTGEAELMDVFCSRPVMPQWLEGAVNQQLPDGIKVTSVQQIAPVLPSLQSQVRFADFIVKVKTEKTEEEIKEAIVHLLSLKTLPWQHKRDTGIKSYDLRLLINEIYLITRKNGIAEIAMRLCCDNRGTGRPEQVTAALGFTGQPELIHRIKLVLENTNEAVKKA